MEFSKDSKIHASMIGEHTQVDMGRNEISEVNISRPSI